MNSIFYHTILESGLQLIQGYLTDFAMSPEFGQSFTVAFGNNYNINLAETLRRQWSRGDFSQLPPLQILPASTLNGADGGYAQQTNTIYISDTFLEENKDNLELVARLLLEEIGHSVDSLINEEDSTGDEGAIFAALVLGETLSEEALQRLRTEHDYATLVVNNREIAIETYHTSDIDYDDDNVLVGDHYHDDEGKRIDAPSNDYINGGGGNDRLLGLTLDDTLDGGSGVDTLIGGSGNDLYYVDRPDDVVIESGDDPDDWVISSSVTYTIPNGIEFLRVDGLGAIEGIGNDEDNQIEGGVGSHDNVANRLEGKGGNDYVIGYGGNDTLVGGEGDDILTGDEGEDSLEGNEGEDDLRGGPDNDVLDGGSDNDYLEGDEGDDILRGQGGDDRLFGDNDGEGDDRLFGGDGNDELNGEFGKDSFFGGAGSDTYILSSSLSGGSIVNDAFEATPLPEDIDLLYFPGEDMRAYLDVGQIGVIRNGVNLIVDISKDGIANADDDLLIVDFFEEETLPDGSLNYVPGVGYIEDFQLLDGFFFIEVNSTEDLSDADPFDFSPDVDLETPGLQVTLRSALEFANKHSSFNVITFDLPSGSTINIKSALPNIEERLVIDGPEFIAPNGDFIPTVEINGSGAGTGVNGFTIKANGAGIFDLEIVNFDGDGILIEGDNTLLSSNYIGVDLTGNQDKGNGGNGINVQSSNNLIRSNVISGNGLSGISIPVPNADNNEILNNKLGTDASGTQALGNDINGIFISAGENHLIQGNLIGGNKNNGIVIDDNSQNNIIEGNRIGVNFDEDGNEIALGNGTRGIWIRDGSNNTIGGEDNQTQGNVIAYNKGAGVSVVNGTGNSVLGNTIFENKNSIDLGDDGYTPNDLLDADSGANNLQNSPPLSIVKEVENPDNTTKKIIEGSFNSTPNTTFRLEFFTDLGRTFYETTNVITDAQGNAGYTIYTPDLEVGTLVQATATNLTTNDTSEIPPTIYIEESYIFIPEGENQSATLKLKVKLSQSSNETVSVEYLTLDGTATSSGDGKEDYQTKKDTVTFLPGDTEEEIEIQVFGDRKVTDEEFEIFARDIAYRNNFESGTDVDVFNGNDQPYQDLGYRVDTPFDKSTGFQAHGLTADEEFYVLFKNPTNVSLANSFNEDILTKFEENYVTNKSAILEDAGDPNAKQNNEKANDTLNTLKENISQDTDTPWTLVPITIYDGNKPPILAVRGTEFSRQPDLDFLADADPRGVGVNQYESAQNDVNEWLKNVSRPKQEEKDDVEFKPHITGHSLGGSLSQLIASGSPVPLEKVVTFNSPGISTPINNSQVESATHYITAADLVSMAGEKYLSGSKGTYTLSSYDSRPIPFALPSDLPFLTGVDKHNLPVTQGVEKIFRGNADNIVEEQKKGLDLTKLSDRYFTYLPNRDYFAFQATMATVSVLVGTGVGLLKQPKLGEKISREGIKIAASLTFRYSTEKLRQDLGEPIFAILEVIDWAKAVVLPQVEGVYEAIETFSVEAWDAIKQITNTELNPIEQNDSLNLVTTNNAESFNVTEVLAQSLSTAQGYLKDFAIAPEFVSQMNIAFGENWDASVGQSLAEQWMNEDFSNLPDIEIVSASNIQNASAAFTLGDQKILIAEEYITDNVNNIEAIAEVLLEEIGHYVDFKINQLDAPGDEGEIFSAVVKNIPLTKEELQALKTEDDLVVLGFEKLGGDTPVDTFWEAIAHWSVEGWEAIKTWTPENWQTITNWDSSMWEATTQFTPEEWENLFNAQEITGTNAVDELTGTTEDNIITGLLGADILTGNGGSDTFVYESYRDRTDTITDFNPSDDFIDLSQIFASSSHNSTTPFESYIQLVQMGSNTEVHINPLGDSHNIFRNLVILEDVTAVNLSADNFIV